jgi:hypothetical protein
MEDNNMNENIIKHTPIQHSFMSGTLVGLAEVYFNHPFWVMKTRNQCGYKFTINPKILFRGVTAEAISMVPIDIVQMVCSTLLNEKLFDNSLNHSFSCRAASGFISGIIGGQLINPVESIMTLQQKYNCTFREVVFKISKKNEWSQFTIGGIETSLRNGIYNCGFFAFTPYLTKKLLPVFHDQNTAVIAAGVTSGITVATITQPIDTIKTIRQSSEGKQTSSLIIKSIYNQNGYIGFFKGLLPRGVRVVSGITVMGLVYDQTESKRTIK